VIEHRNLSVAGADVVKRTEGNINTFLNDLEVCPAGVEEPGMLTRKPWELGRSALFLG